MSPDQWTGAGLLVGLVCALAIVGLLLEALTPRPDREQRR
ncbi:hypothetical protein FBY23_0011 [Nocardioides sp. SLBN-35]|nr:hypothetical protein FBY23_0011 [Nocardioides sp. SLBN-35]